jgi:hypothetical protein
VLYFQVPIQQQAVENFISALVCMYVLALEFLSKAIRLCNENAATRALRAVWAANDLRDFEENLCKLESRLDVEAQNCEACCHRMARLEISQRTEELGSQLNDLQSLKGLSDPILRMESKVTTLWEILDKNERTKLLEWTSQIRHQDHHRMVKDHRTPKTGEWIFRHPQFKSWRESDKSMILWLHGIRM